MASNGVSCVLPPVKTVMVYRNGDTFFTGRRFIVNLKQVSTMETFLNDVTLSIGAPVAVRTLYTPRNGHRVPDLEHLQQGAQYVAAGFERFKKINYLGVGLKRPPVPGAAGPAQAKVPSRPNISAKWRKVITLPCIIYVFRNGDVLSAAMRFIIPRNMQKNLEQILSLVSEKAMLRTGAVRRLCTLEGVTVLSAEELENGQCYVAVGTERFKKLPYVELLLNKAAGGSADRHCPGDRRLNRRTETRKGFPQDTHSDSALLNSPERDARRVKSTGDEVTGGEREESSVFHTKPVHIRRNRGVRRAPARGGAAQPSVFKGASKRREEVRGAEEVAEDESTAVELPVDQRAAEIVEDEELNNSQADNTSQKQEPEEWGTSSQARQDEAAELRASDGEMRASPGPRTEAREDLFTEDLREESSQDGRDAGPHEAETAQPSA